MRTPILSLGGISVIMALSACGVREPEFIPKEVFVQPEARMAGDARVVVFVDMAGLPEDRRAPEIVEGTEEALRKRGFDLVDHNAFMRFLRLTIPLPSSFEEPRVLAKLRDELGRSAIVHALVRDFLAEGRVGDRRKIVTPGAPGVRATPMTQLEEGLRDWREWVLDLSVTLEMVDTRTGARTWSCAVESRRTPYEGRIRDFVRKAVDACLKTIPPR